MFTNTHNFLDKFYLATILISLVPTLLANKYSTLPNWNWKPEVICTENDQQWQVRVFHMSRLSWNIYTCKWNNPSRQDVYTIISWKSRMHFSLILFNEIIGNICTLCYIVKHIASLHQNRVAQLIYLNFKRPMLCNFHIT